MSTLTNSSSSLLFRVPETLRSVNPEAYQPCFFHFGPYAPKFFPSHSDNATQAGAASSHPGYNADSCFKEIMVKDLLCEAPLEALIGKISAENTLEKFLELYPEMPPLKMDFIERQALATGFAQSAVVIVGSVLSLCGMLGIRNHQPSISNDPCNAITRHPLINREYALYDAAVIMENQIPIKLLRLACEAFLHEKCPFSIVFRGQAQGSNSHSDADVTLLAETLLNHVLQICLQQKSPFSFHDSQLQTTSLRSLESYHTIMGYIYESLTGGLPAISTNQNRDTAAVNRGRNFDDPNASGYYERVMSASHLRRYGVMFVADRTHRFFKGIQYDKKTKTLTLPSIQMSDHTLPFFCNLMAYELTMETSLVLTRARKEAKYVGSYLAVLDFLIDTEEDVEVLVRAGVVKSSMEGSNASVAKTWDGLVKNLHVTFTPEHSRILTELRDACKGRARRWWASFKETYWEKKPWLIFSVAAATFLLILAVLQTVFTILPYFHRH